MSQFDKLISELAAFSGLSLEVDGNNSCALSTDDLYITLLYRADLNDIVIFAPVTDPDDGEPGKELLRKALELSYNGSGTRQHFLGLFDDTLVLSIPVPVKDLTARVLGQKIVAFANAAAAVKTELAACRRS
ncbi:type III secretion system chaperone [Succinimonas amylolytica]|uniref:type III secretion system chaperone n=1 Tax=Succinimonas amylolytica TaxID=83769 RepID=UPI00037ECD78|nr:type III secretion system chaperone [Succinimonas amylolytica]